MKILLINKFHYLKGGSERSYFDLGDLLEKDGHQIAYFSTVDEKNFPSEQAKYFIKQNKYDQGGFFAKLKSALGILHNFEANRQLKKLIRDFKPDIAHLHNIYHQLSPSIIKLLKKEKIPVILTVHDYKIVCPNYKMFNQGKICEKCLGGGYYNSFSGKCGGSYLKSFFLMLEAYLHRKILKSYESVDLFIAPSEFVKNILLKDGIQKSKIIVLNHFIDLEKFNSPTESDDGYILYFGRISEEKGIATLLKAAAMLPAADFKLVGEQNPSDKFLPISENVEFLGYKSGAELLDLIRRAGAVVFPSIWNEVFGYAILEAMAMGKPVIASDIGAIGEIIKDNYNGFLFKAGDVEDLKSKLLLINNDLSDIKNKAKTTAFSYNYANYREKIINIYNTLISH
jgi:glycosyltransferase involved in cell wall biosynthesis